MRISGILKDNKLILSIIFLSCSLCFSQKEISWEDLSKVTFTKNFSPEYNQDFLVPEFSKSIKILEGELITITGYFLDLDPEGRLFFLSKGPMTSCFFCGVGGPESAVELQFITKPKFKTDSIVKITGRLVLNTDDVHRLTYIVAKCKGERI